MKPANRSFVATYNRNMLRFQGVWILGQVNLFKNGDFGSSWRRRLAFRVQNGITEKLLGIFSQKEFDVVFRVRSDSVRKYAGG